MDNEETVIDAKGPVRVDRTGARRAWRKSGQSRSAYLLIAPSIVLLVVVIAYPLAETIRLSFSTSTFIKPEPAFVGLDNFAAILRGKAFQGAMVNSLIWIATVVPLQFVVGFGTAMLLNRRIWGRAVLRTLVIIPWILPGAVAGVLFKLVYEPHLGLSAFILNSLGIDSVIPWLGQTSTVLFAEIVAAVWKLAPFSILMYLAGLQGVSRELVEASLMDGAGGLARIRHVYIPQMAPTIRVTLLFTTIATFNYFDIIFVTTGGGPVGASQIIPTQLYTLAFTNGNYGLASAFGMISMGLLACFSFLYLRQIRRAEQEAS